MAAVLQNLYRAHAQGRATGAFVLFAALFASSVAVRLHFHQDPHPPALSGLWQGPGYELFLHPDGRCCAIGGGECVRGAWAASGSQIFFPGLRLFPDHGAPCTTRIQLPQVDLWKEVLFPADPARPGGAGCTVLVLASGVSYRRLASVVPEAEEQRMISRLPDPEALVGAWSGRGCGDGEVRLTLLRSGRCTYQHRVGVQSRTYSARWFAEGENVCFTGWKSQAAAAAESLAVPPFHSSSWWVSPDGHTLRLPGIFSPEWKDQVLHPVLHGTA